MLGNVHVRNMFPVFVLLTSFLTLASSSQTVLAAPDSLATASLRILSYNVRYDSMPDDVSVQRSLDQLAQGVPSEPEYYANTTEQPWSLRRLYIANDILFNRADLFGTSAVAGRWFRRC